MKNLVGAIPLIILIVVSVIWFYRNVIKESPTAKATRFLRDAEAAYASRNLESLKFIRSGISKPKNQAQEFTLVAIDIFIRSLEQKK